ncbi:MAG: hypothetical protein OXG16_03235 [Rhodospirillales bacterium]|nr:hypothetical protein [Rhodospirillales bacterium]MDE0711327.1 hypothetical protein [Rhodospirillales bacterium]
MRTSAFGLAGLRQGQQRRARAHGRYVLAGSDEFDWAKLDGPVSDLSDT